MSLQQKPHWQQPLLLLLLVLGTGPFKCKLCRLCLWYPSTADGPLLDDRPSQQRLQQLLLSSNLCLQPVPPLQQPKQQGHTTKLPLLLLLQHTLSCLHPLAVPYLAVTQTLV